MVKPANVAILKEYGEQKYMINNDAGQLEAIKQKI